MPPKKPPQPTGNKKTQEKKKEKIIEVRGRTLACRRVGLADQLALKCRTHRRLASLSASNWK